MQTPLRYQGSLGWPAHDFYRSWLHDKRAKGADKDFREALWLNIREQESSEITRNLFSVVRNCTPAQLTELAGRLKKEKFSLILDSMQDAISGFGDSGSLAKVQSFFGAPTWDDFKTSLALYESFSSRYMPLYVDDVLAWSAQASHPDDTASDHLLMRIALNGCPCDTAQVVSVMQRLGPVDFDDRANLVQATDYAVSLVYDTPPELRNSKAAELAEQLVRLHDGWGIRYPAALLTRILQKEHNKDFFLPSASLMTYEGHEDDMGLAALFGAKGTTASIPKTEALSMGVLVHSLYEESQVLAFCVEGASAVAIHRPQFEPPMDIFQDVGQP